MVVFWPGHDSPSLPGPLQPGGEVSLSQSVVNIQPDHGPVLPENCLE